MIVTSRLAGMDYTSALDAKHLRFYACFCFCFCVFCSQPMHIFVVCIFSEKILFSVQLWIFSRL